MAAGSAAWQSPHVGSTRRAVRKFWKRSGGEVTEFFVSAFEPPAPTRPEPRSLGVSRALLQGHAIDSSLLFVTLTNAGYLPYTRNFRASLARVGLADELVVFCTDDESLAALRAEGVNACRVNQPGVGSEFQRFREGSFREATLAKLRVVHELLELGFDVLFSDADIVFLDNPIDVLQRAAARVSLVIQNDDSYQNVETDPMRVPLCMGFFMVRPTPRTLRVFDPTRVPADCPCDQSYMNSVKSEVGRIRLLDRDLFPMAAGFSIAPASITARARRLR